MATILIIDDRRSTRVFLMTLLGSYGHRLVEATDGADALVVAMAERPDLVITDILMPTMDGYEFVHRLHADPALRDTPVIFWSVYSLEPEARALTQACGLLYFLVKSCAPEEVLRTVQAALDHAPAPITALPEGFDWAPLHVLTDKLVQTEEELSTANRKLGALIETGRGLALPRDLPQLLDDCCRTTREIIGAQWVVLGMLDDEGRALHHFATAGLAPEMATFIDMPQLHQGVFGELLHGRSVCRLRDVGGDPQTLGFSSGYPPIHALLGVTIASPLRVYGCLVLANKLGTDAFSEEDERLATTLAAQVAVAYESASLSTTLAQQAAAFGREVAAHQQTEVQLRRAEVRYRTLVEQTPAITYIAALHAPNGTLYISPQVEAILGFTPAEWTADPQLWSTRLHPQDRARVLASLIDSQTTQQPFFEEYRLYTRDNHEIWCHHEAAIVQDNGDGPLCFQGIMLDITERKRSEEALRDSEARYRDLVDHANDILCTLDLAGSFTSFNRKGEQVTGYTRAEALQMTLSDLVAPAQRASVHEMIGRTLAGIATPRCELNIVAKSGHLRTLEFHTRPLFEGQQPVGMQGIARDVTEHKHLEAQLRQAHKMEAIGTLAGGIAHDFNNILFAILGYTELTLDDVPYDSRAWRNLQQVLVAGGRARELVCQLLTFSRQTEPNRQPVLLHLLVKEVLLLLRAALPATITLRETLDDTTGQVLADATQIHQVLLNLCTNAEYAMRTTGGVLEVRLDACEVTADRSTALLYLEPGPYLRLTLQDTGPGIPPEIMERIFEPFFTTKEAGEGSGLGLAVAHGIVSRHGGTMTVTSTPGQGTTFEVYLPRSDQPIVVAGGGLEEAILTGSERLLFVDDEEVLARLGQAALTRLGYDVASFTSSPAALDAFRAAPERFDLLITDQTMPHMTGRMLAQAVRRIRPDIPIILCTGFSHIMTAEKAAALGIDAFCMKPLSFRDLALVIRRVLAPRTERPGDTEHV